MGIYRDVTDEAAAEVARAVSDIYASKLQITGALQAAPQWAFARGETSTPDADWQSGSSTITERESCAEFLGEVPILSAWSTPRTSW